MEETAEWRPGPPLPTVCRCCLAEGCYKDISTEYFWNGRTEVYSEMLSSTFDINISYSQSGGPNSNSRLICEACIARLRDATEFKKQVVECEKTFMQHLDPGRSTTVELEITPELGEKDVKLERVKEERGLDAYDDIADFADADDDLDDEDDLDDQPLTKLASKLPKKETVDILDLIDNKAATKRKATIKLKASPSKKSKTKEKAKPKEAAKASASKEVVKREKKKKGSDTVLSTTNHTKPKRIVPLFQVEYDRSLCKPLGTVTDFSKINMKLLKSNCLKSVSRAFTPSRSPSPIELEISHSPPEPQYSSPTHILVRPKVDSKRRPDVRQNALIVFEFTTVYPFIYGNNKFKCFVCSQPFLETVLLRRHMNENHTFGPLKRLVNNKRENVLKVDVSEMTCNLCSVMLKNFVELKVHLKEAHQKPIDPDLQDNMIPFKLDGVEGTYKCVICDESFMKVRILVIHMSVHFSNYSCEICGSGFMTLRLLKKHLEVHENGNFPCDRCNKVFTTPHKRSLHIRGVHLKQYPRRCPMCPERFNSNYRRTIHLQDVHNQSTRVHKCDQCDRAFNLKYHLICHTRSVHLQERNQQCDICLQRFCNKETLKRHMVIHTGEKNYKCEICGMAFLRRKNLKDHLRVHEVV